MPGVFETSFFVLLAVTYAFFLLPLASVFDEIQVNQVFIIVVAL
jgi:hypothetical protein